MYIRNSKVLLLFALQSCQCSEKIVSDLLLTMPEMRGPRGEPGPRGDDGEVGKPGLTVSVS